ncbi:ATP-binding cassette domain-containing protein [Acidianus manzaensis]|uniref:Mn2+/Zn2+ABC transporter ATP-binding protein n=1 Tax=Acidianus manzaensis TaxID=282676 RepID=A0A1W6JYG9_9CREN|nr:ATP-binding cassette domain-containing protein [Acidianus manzaensis]ARM75361.1 Mn2+/Zn2+ABC transporter ATP-binding protein [Acidianus manzaensis]
MINYNDLTIKFSDVTIFKELNLHINQHSIVIGPNGSGKTTLIKATCGLIPYRGKILVDGQGVKKIKNYLNLSTNIPEVYTIGREVKDIAEIYSEIKDLELDVFRDLLKELRIYDEVINKKIFKLSAGQSVIVRTVLALSSPSKNLLIDEPFENVDPSKRLIIARFLKENVKDGFITTHELDLLKQFNSWPLYIILNGKVYGPIITEDFLNSTIVEGEAPNAILTLDLDDKKISIVKDNGSGIKLLTLGNINRLYGVL